MLYVWLTMWSPQSWLPAANGQRHTYQARVHSVFLCLMLKFETFQQVNNSAYSSYSVWFTLMITGTVVLDDDHDDNGPININIAWT